MSHYTHTSQAAQQYQYVSPQQVMSGPASGTAQRHAQVNWTPDGIAHGHTNTHFQDPYAYTPGLSHSSGAYHPSPASLLSSSPAALFPQAPAPRFPSHHPTKRPTECLPRPAHLNPAHASCPPIVFSVEGVPGPRIKDILQGRVRIDGEGECDFDKFGWRATCWGICWPGYPTDNMRISTKDSAGRPITRGALVKLICDELTAFMQMASGKRVQRGCERWTIGPEAIRLSDVRLLSLHLHKTVWVPELLIAF